MAYKCVIWGTGVLYDEHINNIYCEIVKKNIEIVAVVSNDRYIHSIDGFTFVEKKDLDDIIYDYVIVACDYHSAEREALALGISKEKLIKIQVFRLPRFDLNEYVRLKESDISIVSNHCWGGFAYHTLGLRFGSPFVNLFIDEKDYIRLLSNFEHYMDQQLEMYKDSDPFGEPIGLLEDIKINFLHYDSFKTAKETWDRRKQRLNYENLFVEMTIREYPDVAQDFVRLSFKKKKCFVHFDTEDSDDCVQMSEFFDVSVRKKYDHRFKEYMHNTAEIDCRISRPYDLIRLLNGNADFMRKTFIKHEYKDQGIR